MEISRAFACTRVTSRPAIRMLPLVAISRPAIRRRVVVLPQPEGPNNVTSEPAGTSNETSSTAMTLP
jgi:hypothetical protein